MHDDTERSTGADRDLQAVEALVDAADGEQIWQVLDLAQERSVSVAEAYREIIGDLPAH